MASINPPGRKTAPAAPPPAARPDLLSRVVSQPGGPAKVLQTPPPAKLPPGVSGNPPLPARRIVSQLSADNLTDVERQTLAAAGWSEDLPLPATQEGIKQLQDAIAHQDAVDVPLPLDPRTPAVKFDPVPIETLPAAKRTEIVDRIRGITAEETRAAAAAKRGQDVASKEAAVKGLGGAAMAADKSVAEFERRVRAAAEEPLDPVPPPAAGPPAAVSETGAAGSLEKCPHCNWDLALPDVPDPPYSDKMAFVQAMLSDKPFQRSTPLFNGQLEISLRTLTAREIDLCYKQAWADQQAGQFNTELDYWEKINRYRLMLQLVAFRATAPGGVHHTLNDGYSPSTNPGATTFWQSAGDEEAGKTSLPDIEEWVMANVLRTETVLRVVSDACRKFNRTVSRLEAMADHSDFWKPTGEQS